MSDRTRMLVLGFQHSNGAPWALVTDRGLAPL
jgi:hypothetical protein